MRVIVTGGSGFIGKALSAELAARGDEVIVADLRDNPDAKTIAGDLSDPAHVERVFEEGADAVVHLAAFTSVLASIRQPWEVYRTNVEMTARLLEAARLHEVAGFVMASTNAVVGNAEELPIHEKIALRPLTPYGATKAAGEMLCSAYSAAYGMAAGALRLTNVYGPGMSHKDSFVPRLMKAASAGQGVEVYGDGSMVRDYVYVGDVVAGFMLALDRKLTGPLIIGSGQAVSVNELIAGACRATKVEIPVSYGQAREGEMAEVVVDISLARSLGFVPRTSLDEGLAAAWTTFSADSEE